MSERDKYRVVVAVSRAAALAAVLVTLYIALFVSRESFKPEDSVWRTLLTVSLWIQGVALLALIMVERKKRKAVKRAETGIENE